MTSRMASTPLPSVTTVLSVSEVPAPTRPRGLSVRHNFLWALAGNIAYAGSQWVMLMLLTKRGSPELVGQFALGLALTAPIILLANLQLRSIQATDAAAQFKFPDYFTLRAVAVTLAVAAIGGLAALGGYHANLSHVIFALGMARGVECLSEVFVGLFQRQERMDLVAASLVLKGGLSLAGFATAIILTHSLVWAVWSLFFAWTAVLLCFDLPLGRRMAVAGGDRRWFSPARCWRPLAWMALPLGIAAMLKAVENSLPRYFIELNLGERELGFFAAAAYLTIVGIQIITALSLAAAPRLANLHTQGERTKFVRLMLKLLGSGLAIGLVGFFAALFAGRPLLSIIYAPEYAAYYGVLLWLTAAAVVTYVQILLGTSLNALRVFRFRLPVHLLALAVLTSACLVLGRPNGLMGMAWAIALSELFTAACYASALLWALRRVPIRSSPIDGNARSFSRTFSP